MAISDFLDRARSAAGFAPDEDPEGLETEPLETDILPPDPVPIRAKRQTRVPPPTPTAKIKKQVKDSLLVMMGFPAGMISFRDPVCGGALGSQSEAIADALVPIICRNPSMLRWFTEGQGMMDWITLMTAVWPVMKTVWDHHTGRVDEGDGDDDDDWQQYPAPRMAA